MLVRSTGGGSGNEKLAITRNQQWSVTALTDATSGTVLERYTYDHFGKRTILEANGTTVRATSSYNMPFGYTSRQHDAETGLMYFRARYYDPASGEFTSPDPLEYVDGMCLYRGYFVPRSIDPLGLACDEGPCPCDDPASAGTWFMGPPLPPSPGRPIPGTGGNGQNCQGAACGIEDWLQPSKEEFDEMIGIGPEKWFKEKFNPFGKYGTCKVVECSDNPMMRSPCECEEREIFGWLALRADNSVIDAHFVGRTVVGCFAPTYESKAGGGVRWEDITDPDGHDTHIYGNLKPAKNVKVCWCCSLKKKVKE